METFIVKKRCKGKNLADFKKYELKVGDILYKYNSYLLFPKEKDYIVVCVYNSQLAKDYFVWNGDDCGDERWGLERNILSRMPFKHNSVELLWSKYKHMLREDAPDTILFNDYFYSQSHIAELKALIEDLEKVIEDDEE